jgi:hypothetical protein
MKGISKNLGQVFRDASQFLRGIAFTLLVLLMSIKSLSAALITGLRMTMELRADGGAENAAMDT